MSTSSARRLAVLSGLAAMAAWVASFVFEAIPSLDTPAATFSSHLADHSLRLLAYGLLIEAGAALLVGFFVGLAYLHREADRSVGPLAITGAAAGVMTQVVVIAGAALAQLAVVTADRGATQRRPRRSFKVSGCSSRRRGSPRS